MSLYVASNTSSINSQRQLSKSTKALDSSYQKLASGLRINTAKDDAAGLQISNRMSSQINGLTQGNRNANDGISMCQTAEGALDEVTNMMQRMRTLAIQSANGTNSDSERTAIGDEITQLKAEIERIGENTSFGGTKKILNLAEADQKVTFQVGSNANEAISIDMSTLESLTADAASIDLSTRTLSEDAIDKLDDSIQKVDSYRSKLGAVQNRLESTISNQENVIENVSDARSRIRDVDYASETANMSQQRILQQASTSILSQANQKTSIALNLLG